MNQCLKCGADLSGYLPYGSKATCNVCGQEHETEWDEIDLDNTYWWITRKAA